MNATSIAHADAPPRRVPSWLNQLAAARFFTFSMLLHVIIVIVVGTSVIYRPTEEPPDFVAAGEEGLVAEATSSAPPPEQVVTPDPVFTPSTPAVSAPALSAVATTATSTYAMNTLPVTSQGLADKGAAALDAIAKKLGDGMSAAMGRAGGTSGMIFGRRVEAKKLGVILDVSASAHPHLAGAIKEIEKSFSDSIIFLMPGCGMGETRGRSAHDIRKFSSVKDRELSDQPPQRSTAEQLVKALKIEEFENLVRRPAMKERLYVSWFEGGQNTGGGSLISQTQVSFESLMKLGVDSIYWFADFRDAVSGEVVEELVKDLKRRKIKVYLHNFAGNKIGPEAMQLAENTGGTANTEKP